MDYYLLSNKHVAQVEEVSAGFEIGSFDGKGECEHFPEPFAGSEEEALSSFLSTYDTEVTVIESLGTYGSMYECLGNRPDLMEHKKSRPQEIREYATAKYQNKDGVGIGKLDKFGFKDIVIEANIYEKSVIDNIEKTFEAIAKNLGIQDKDIGLNNTMTLEIKTVEAIRNPSDDSAKKPTTPEAYFTSDYHLVIHPGLDRMIHEWGHALDSFIANAEKGLEPGKLNRESKQKFLFFKTEDMPVNKSFDIKFPPRYIYNSIKGDILNPNKKDPVYYQSKNEMFARAFERYMTDRIVPQTDIPLNTDFNDIYEPTSKQAAKVIKQIISSIQELKKNHVLHERDEGDRDKPHGGKGGKGDGGGGPDDGPGGGGGDGGDGRSPCKESRDYDEKSSLSSLDNPCQNNSSYTDDKLEFTVTDEDVPPDVLQKDVLPTILDDRVEIFDIEAVGINDGLIAVSRDDRGR